MLLRGAGPFSQFTQDVSVTKRTSRLSQYTLRNPADTAINIRMVGAVPADAVSAGHGDFGGILGCRVAQRFWADLGCQASRRVLKTLGGVY